MAAVVEVDLRGARLSFFDFMLVSRDVTSLKIRIKESCTLMQEEPFLVTDYAEDNETVCWPVAMLSSFEMDQKKKRKLNSHGEGNVSS